MKSRVGHFMIYVLGFFLFLFFFYITDLCLLCVFSVSEEINNEEVHKNALLDLKITVKKKSIVLFYVLYYIGDENCSREVGDVVVQVQLLSDKRQERSSPKIYFIYVSDSD